MSADTAWGYTPPDDPQRRLFWIVPLAVLLVLLFILGIGHWLVAAAPSKPPPPPVDARIYELPASKASMFTPPHRPTAPPTHAAPHATPSPPTHTAKAPSRSAAPHAAQPPSESAGQPEPRVSLPAKPAQGKAGKTQPQPATPANKPFNMAKLNASINAAVASTITRSELPQIHDPHTLVARFYLASVLRKLQYVGDMNYPGDMVGNARVLVVIGSHGELVGYKLLDSSGNPALDKVAGSIVHMSAPFAPFPNKMSRETHRIKLVITMRFEGYRNLNPE